MKKVILLISILLAAPVLVSAQTTAFVGVNVIPMDRERVLANQTVIVKGGVIAEIGDAKKVKVPKDAVTVDGKGKYLIPGLVDMHTHLLSDGDEYPDSIAEDELRVMVANGVTTIRFMIGTPELLSLRGRSAKGEIAAPTIFVASPHLTGREQGNNFVVNTRRRSTRGGQEIESGGLRFYQSHDIRTSRKFTKRRSMKRQSRTSASSATPTASSSASTARWKAKQQIEHLDGYMEHDPSRRRSDEGLGLRPIHVRTRKLGKLRLHRRSEDRRSWRKNRSKPIRSLIRRSIF